MTPDLARAQAARDPFPHFRAPGLIEPGLAGAALAWLRDKADWRLRLEDFYEQHEVDLLGATPPAPVADLVSDAFVAAVRQGLEGWLPDAGPLELVGVCAHRLTAGQTIRIHNDHIGEEETHRLLVQLNEGWSAERGGLLMIFAGDGPETLADVIMPEHGSGFGFEISARSYHAVSTVHSGERFTVVYTFRRSGA